MEIPTEEALSRRKEGNKRLVMHLSIIKKRYSIYTVSFFNVLNINYQMLYFLIKIAIPKICESIKRVRLRH